MKSSKGTVLIAAFFVLLCFPMASKLTGLEYHTTLYNVSIASEPQFDLDSYWDGSYQKAYEQYEKTNFGNYPAIVKAYAQLRYNAFQLLSSETVMGNGSIDVTAYISNALKLENATIPSPEEVPSLFSKLSQLKELLNAQGKDLVVLLDPGKLDFISEDIPLRYQWRATYRTREGLSTAELLYEWAQENDVSYVNGPQIAEQVNMEGVPPFYYGSSHASKPVMFWITQALCQNVKELGYPIKSVQFNGYATNSMPIVDMRDGIIGSSSLLGNYDADLFRNTNLYYQAVGDECFYYPLYEVVEDDYHVLPSIFLMGRSFCTDIRLYLTQSQICRQVYQCRTDEFIVNSNLAYTYWSDKRITPTIQQALADSEIIVLEYNSYNHYRYLDEELNLLLDLLQKPVTKAKLPLSFDRLYPSLGYTNVVSGFFRINEANPSDDFYWMSTDGIMNLSANDAFVPQSVVLDCSIPADAFETYWGKDVSGYEYLVYVNGHKIASFPVGEERRETFHFDISGVDAPNGEYCIEIVAPLYAQWKNVIAGSTDDRELSLRVYSCTLSPHCGEDGEGREDG